MSAMCVTILPGMGISINKVIVHFLVCSLSLSSIQQSGNVACPFCFTASPAMFQAFAFKKYVSIFSFSSSLCGSSK